MADQETMDAAREAAGACIERALEEADYELVSAGIDYEKRLAILDEVVREEKERFFERIRKIKA